MATDLPPEVNAAELITEELMRKVRKGTDAPWGLKPLLRFAAPLIVAAAAPAIRADFCEGTRLLAAQWRASAEALASSDPLRSSHFYDSAMDLERVMEGEW